MPKGIRPFSVVLLEPKTLRSTLRTDSSDDLSYCVLLIPFELPIDVTSNILASVHCVVLPDAQKLSAHPHQFVVFF